MADDSQRSLGDLAEEVTRAEDALQRWRGLRNAAMKRRLDEGATWDDVMAEASVSRATVASAMKSLARGAA